MPCQGLGGCGGCQRSAPTGGAAYGMPRNSSAAATAFPRTAPPAVATTRPALWPWFWLWVGLWRELLPEAAGPVVQAAAAISSAAAAATAVSLVRTRCPIGIARIAALTWSGAEQFDCIE